jgi:polyisoprenoid-binding protein YceI
MRSRLFLLTCVIPLVSAAQSADLPTRFEIDGAHSAISFSVRFMGLSTVRGAFSRFGGAVMFYPGDLTRSTVSAIIAASSINTNHQDRDRHLRSPDFLDAEKFPYITFRSSAIRETAQGFVAEGDLMLHGVTKQISIPFVMMHPPTTDAWQNTRVTFHGSLRVRRKDYDIRGTAFWNSEFDPGRFAVSDEVEIDLLVSGLVPNPLRWSHPVGDSILAAVEARGVAPVLREYRTARVSNPRIDSLPDFALSLVAEKLIARGRTADAVAFYETLVETRRAPLLRAQLGEAYLKAGRIEQALAQFEVAAQRDSLNPGVTEWIRVLKRR